MDKNTLVSVGAILQNFGSILDVYINEVYQQLEKEYEHFEVVLVDNGSTDASVDVARNLMKTYRNLRLVVLSREYDEQVAFTAVLESCIGDFVVIMNPNTDPVNLISEMIITAASGYDIVSAEVSGDRNEPFLYSLLAKAFYRISNVLTDYRVDLNWSNYVCFSRKMVNATLQIKDRVRYLKYIKTDIGYSHMTVKYEQINRNGQKSDKKVWNRIFFAFDTLVSNSEKLMRIANSTALLTSFLSFGYILYVLAIKVFKSNVPEGWASTSIIFSLLFGLMFFILFIIGEYVSLVYKETRRGPLYHVADEFNSSVLFENMREKNVI